MLRWIGGKFRNMFGRRRISVHDRPTILTTSNNLPTDNHTLTLNAISNIDSTKTVIPSRDSSLSSRLTAASESTNHSTQSPIQQEERRGRDRTRRVNVNAERSSRASLIGSPQFVSPTNKANQADPNEISQYEADFIKIKNGNINVWNCTFPPETIVVYTDASHLKSSNVSGIGIYMGPGHELNRSQRVRGPIQDNNFAEMLAAKVALQNLNSWPKYRGEKVIVRTDNMGVINAVQNSGGPFPQLTQKLQNVCGKFPQGVSFEHVYAHKGDPGNEMADTLAGLATARRSKSASFARNSSASRERNYRRSRSNEPAFIRSHSAHVGRRSTKPDSVPVPVSVRSPNRSVSRRDRSMSRSISRSRSRRPKSVNKSIYNSNNSTKSQGRSTRNARSAKSLSQSRNRSASSSAYSSGSVSRSVSSGMDKSQSRSTSRGSGPRSGHGGGHGTVRGSGHSSRK